jgi:hypothetical protein
MTPLELSEVTLQVVALPTTAILTTLAVSFMLTESFYSTGITHDDHHLQLSYCLQYTPLVCYYRARLGSYPQCL